MLRELRAPDTVAATAFEGIEVVQLADGRTQLRRQRHHVGANPVRNRGSHRTAQDCRRLQRHPLGRRHHNRLKAHKIFTAASTGAFDGRNRRRNRDIFGQRLPASRRFRRLGLRGLLRWHRLTGRASLRLTRGGRIGRPRPRQRHIGSCLQRSCAGKDHRRRQNNEQRQ